MKHQRPNGPLLFDGVLEPVAKRRRALCMYADGVSHNDLDADDEPANDVEPSRADEPREGVSLDLSHNPRGRHRAARRCA